MVHKIQPARAKGDWGMQIEEREEGNGMRITANARMEHGAIGFIRWAT